MTTRRTPPRQASSPTLSDEPDFYIEELPRSTPDIPGTLQDDGSPLNPVDLIEERARFCNSLLESVIHVWHSQRLAVEKLAPAFDAITGKPLNFEAQLARRLAAGTDLLHDALDVLLGKDLKKVRRYWKRRLSQTGEP